MLYDMLFQSPLTHTLALTSPHPIQTKDFLQLCSIIASYIELPAYILYFHTHWWLTPNSLTLFLVFLVFLLWSWSFSHAWSRRRSRGVVVHVQSFCTLYLTAAKAITITSFTATSILRIVDASSSNRVEAQTCFWVVGIARLIYITFPLYHPYTLSVHARIQWCRGQLVCH